MQKRKQPNRPPQANSISRPEEYTIRLFARVHITRQSVRESGEKAAYKTLFSCATKSLFGLKPTSCLTTSPF